MTQHFPQLSITTLENGNLRLEDTSYSEGAIVDVHPVHVRSMAEQLGLIAIAEPVDPDAKTMAELRRDIDRLQRSLLRVRDHAIQLHREFAESAGWREADLTYEMRLAAALVDILDLAVDDFADGYTAIGPDVVPPVSGVVTRDTHVTNTAATTQSRAPPAPAPQQQMEIPA